MFLVMGDFAIAVGRVAKDATLAHVGDNKQYQRCKFALNVGKDMDLVNCTAWRSIASGCATLKKGEQVLVIGQAGQHEYQGKTYTDLTVEFCGVTLAREPGIDDVLANAKDVPFPADDPF